MEKTKIGVNAGKVWRILNEKGELSMFDLCRDLGLTFEDYYNAIITVCNKYSINVIDVYKDSDYNTAYQEYKADTLNGDGVHPLQKSFFKYYMPIIEKSMKY